MSWFPTLPALGTLDPDEPPRTWFSATVDWLAEARSHRVIVLVLSIWLLNAFDLTLTILAHEQGMLQEENPLAREVLRGGVVPVMLYKVGLVLIGSYPLLRFRASRVTELGALVVICAYAGLAVHWSDCYELYALAASQNVTLSELETIMHGSTP